MEIIVSSYKHCDVLALSGRIDSATSPKFGEAIKALTDQLHFRIVLNLSKVEFMSSAGLRVLINAQKTCKRYNRGEVVLTEVPENIQAALELSGFTPLFKFYENALEAVGSF
jgi:anti-sigma B factor antagonist